ncbi:MAG: hypothetical protein RBG1_1C00001G0708 [candidate division Zixibacteria bacterium RBG-1]|nr:MAG: hypothetical protein RBG1_1C00001G0708 [candidate division Zixibacteria bacterium RBG-1]OGC86347.1 MAG: agmatinase [candidate division Zixibacteria bacterium RBG_19FT_COMBO_42_43]
MTSNSAFSFLGLPPPYSDFKKSKFVILPVPYEQTTTFKTGTKNGPQAIISASREVELFDEELEFEPHTIGIATLQDMEVTALGPEKMSQRIYQTAKKLVSQNKFVIMLGGEHSITYGLVKAYQKKYKDLTVLQLDAHADLRESYQDNKFSHACAMKRVWEICPVVGVGIRNLSEAEFRFVKQKKINLFYARDLQNYGTYYDEIVNSLSNNVFLTFDLDYFDPSIMPAVGTPEPGGLYWYETLELLKKVIQKKNLVGFDVVELSPLPGNVAPDFLAAKLIYKLISYQVAKQKKLLKN